MVTFTKIIEVLCLHSPLKRMIKEKKELENDLKTAMVVQSNMLPRAFSDTMQQKGFDIYATMQPAKKVGGDFYDFFMTDKDHITVVIADVSGKGIAAAMFMAMAKPLIKNQAMLGLSPEQVLNAVNQQLCKNNKGNMFITVFIGVLNLKNGQFIYANAGHTKPLIYKNSGGFTWLHTKPEFVLAGNCSKEYVLEKTKLNPGDMLFLYTDGITEALNKNEEIFTEKRLIDILNRADTSKLSVKSVINTVKKAVTAFSKGTQQSDDIAMMTLKYCKRLSDKTKN